MKNEFSYLSLVNEVLNFGYLSDSRAGETYSLPGTSIQLDLRESFPLLTTRKIFTAGIFGELAAFVRGAEDLATFKKFGCNYWDTNAANWAKNAGKPKEEWQIGKSYGSLWRNFHGVDQLQSVIESIKKDPYSRRHVVTAWDPSAEACLPSCHIMFQFYVRDGYLNCHVYMRSVDLCVGLPSDIALYALLMELVAKDTELIAARLTFSFGDAHVYIDHTEQYVLQRRQQVLRGPRLKLADETTTLTFEPQHAEVIDYTPAPAMSYKFMA